LKGGHVAAGIAGGVVVAAFEVRPRVVQKIAGAVDHDIVILGELFQAPRQVGGVGDAVAVELPAQFDEPVVLLAPRVPGRHELLPHGSLFAGLGQGFVNIPGSLIHRSGRICQVVILALAQGGVYPRDGQRAHRTAHALGTIFDDHQALYAGHAHRSQFVDVVFALEGSPEAHQPH
jgi:hypothetical protein